MSPSAAVDWACPECSYANVGGKYYGMCGEPYFKCMLHSVPTRASKAPVAAIAMTREAQDPGEELGGGRAKLDGKLLKLSRANGCNACARKQARLLEKVDEGARAHSSQVLKSTSKAHAAKRAHLLTFIVHQKPDFCQS